MKIWLTCCQVVTFLCSSFAESLWWEAAWSRGSLEGSSGCLHSCEPRGLKISLVIIFLLHSLPIRAFNSDAACQMARLGFFYLIPRRRDSNPRHVSQSVELHQTSTFEGRSTDWATAPRQAWWLIRALATANTFHLCPGITEDTQVLGFEGINSCSEVMTTD